MASDLEQIGDILEDDVTAKLVKPGNIENLADGIFELLNDEVLARQMGINARKNAEECYTWEQHVKRILKKLGAGDH